MKFSFQKSKIMLNSTNGQRVVNSPSLGKYFGKKYVKL